MAKPKNQGPVEPAGTFTDPEAEDTEDQTTQATSDADVLQASREAAERDAQLQAEAERQEREEPEHRDRPTADELAARAAEGHEQLDEAIEEHVTSNIGPDTGGVPDEGADPTQTAGTGTPLGEDEAADVDGQQVEQPDGLLQLEAEEEAARQRAADEATRVIQVEEGPASGPDRPWLRLEGGLFFRRGDFDTVQIGVGPNFESVTALQTIDPEALHEILTRVGAQRAE